MLESRILLAVDPGVHGLGAALFRGTGLMRAAYITHKSQDSLVDQLINGFVAETTVSDVLIERQRIYPTYKGAKAKIDPNDLLDVSRVVGRIEERFRAWGAKLIYPQDWKGQVPKEVMLNRIKRTLTPDEMRNIVSAGSKDHNIVDAIGIGLFAVGRCKVGCPKGSEEHGYEERD